MTRDRIVTYPADAVQRIADRLQEMDWNLRRHDAEDYALDIVVEVTAAVDKLRAQEAGES